VGVAPRGISLGPAMMARVRAVLQGRAGTKPAADRRGRARGPHAESSMVSSSFFDPSLLLCARLALIPAVCLCAGSTATCQDDPEALVARIETWHGESAPPESLAISGTFTVTFEGVPAAGSELKGTFRQLFAGDELARTTADLGEHGSLESGCTPDLVWEV